MMRAPSLPADIEAAFRAALRTMPSGHDIRMLAQFRARLEVQLGRAQAAGDAAAIAAVLADARRKLAAMKKDDRT